MPVAWGEMDALQHVNNMVYFRYFESVRMAYFAAIEFMQYLEETGIGPILASTQAQFRLPLTWPDTVTVAAREPEMETDRFKMEYRIVSHKQDAITTFGEGTIVSYDYRNLTKSPLPAEIRRRISDLEGL